MGDDQLVAIGDGGPQLCDRLPCLSELLLDGALALGRADRVAADQINRSVCATRRGEVQTLNCKFKIGGSAVTLQGTRNQVDWHDL